MKKDNNKEDLLNIISDLYDSVEMLEDDKEDLKAQVEELLEESKLLEQILDEAEATEYSSKTFRKLDTKQDLIDTIRKEILNDYPKITDEIWLKLSCYTPNKLEENIEEFKANELNRLMKLVTSKFYNERQKNKIKEDIGKILGVKIK